MVKKMSNSERMAYVRSHIGKKKVASSKAKGEVAKPSKKKVSKTKRTHNMVPLDKKTMKELGIKMGKDGPMIDKTRMGQKKEYSRPSVERPERTKPTRTRVVKSPEDVKAEQQAAQREVDIGVY